MRWGKCYCKSIRGLHAGPSIGEETILYSDCEANNIKLAKALTDCLGNYTRWDVARLQVRDEPWVPEVKMERNVFAKLSKEDLRRISEEHEVDEEKLLAILQELGSL